MACSSAANRSGRAPGTFVKGRVVSRSRKAATTDGACAKLVTGTWRRAANTQRSTINTAASTFALSRGLRTRAGTMAHP